MHFIFVGNFIQPVHELIKLARERGHDVSYSYKRGVDCVVVPDVGTPPAGLKITLAQRDGVPLIDENTFLNESWGGDVDRSISGSSSNGARPAPLEVIMDAAPGPTSSSSPLEWNDDEKTLKLFVSSPFVGLEEHRAALHAHLPALERALAAAGVRPVLLDMSWGVTDEEVAANVALARCLDLVREAQVFVLLLDRRTGTAASAAAVDQALVGRVGDDAPLPWLVPGKSITHLEILCSLHDSSSRRPLRIFFDVRQGGAGAKETAPLPAELAEMHALAERAFDVCERGVTAPEACARRLVELLKEAPGLTRSLPGADGRPGSAGGEGDDAELEWLAQQAEARRLRRAFIEPAATAEALDAFVSAAGDDCPSLCWLTGEAKGKSAVCASLASRWRGRRRDCFVHLHCFAVSRSAPLFYRCLQRHVESRAGCRLGLEVNDASSFHSLLQFVSDRFERVLLVIDGLDQLEEGALVFPARLPLSCRLVVSQRAGPPPPPPVCLGLTVAPLSADEAVALVERVLLDGGKRAPDFVEAAVRTHGGDLMRDPLHLKLLLELLVKYSRYDRLRDDFARLLECQTTAALYTKYLELFERRYAPAGPAVLQLLWSARSGLTEAELTELVVAMVGGSGSADATSIELVLSALGQSRVPQVNGLYQLADRHLKKALRQRFGRTVALDRQLFAFFRRRTDANNYRSFIEALFHLGHIEPSSSSSSSSSSSGAGAGDGGCSMAQFLLERGPVHFDVALRHLRDRGLLVACAATVLHADGGWANRLIERVAGSGGAADTLCTMEAGVASLLLAVPGGSDAVQPPSRMDRFLEESADRAAHVFGRASTALAVAYEKLAQWRLARGDGAAAVVAAQRCARVRELVAGDPAARANAALLLGQAQLAVLSYDKAAVQLRAAVDSGLLPVVPELQAKVQLARALLAAGATDEAQAVASQAEMRLRSNFPRSPMLRSAVLLLAKIEKKRGALSAAARLLEPLVREQDKEHGQEQQQGGEDATRVLVDYAHIQRKLGHFEEAEQAYARLAGNRAVELDVCKGRGLLAKKKANYSQALPLLEKAVRLSRSPGEQVGCLTDLADCLRKLGRFDEAVETYTRAKGVAATAWTEVHADCAPIEYGLSQVYKAQRKFKLAEQHARQEIGVVEATTETGASRGRGFKYALAQLNLANVWRKTDRERQAEQLIRQLLPLLEASLGPEHLETIDAMRSLALTLAALGRFAEAERWLRDAIDRLSAAGAATAARRAGLLVDLAGVLVQCNHSNDAIGACFDQASELLVQREGLLWAELLHAKACWMGKRRLADSASVARDARRALLTFFDEFHPKVVELKKYL